MEKEVISEGAEIGVFNLMEFKDKDGYVHAIREDDENDVMEGSDKDHFILYYNPRNASEYMMLNPGKYLVIIFLPFGLLCSYLGWPQKEDKD